MAIRADIAESDDFFVDEDKSLSITVYQSDGTTSQDVTAYAMEWALKASPDALVPLLTKTTATGSIATAGNVATVTILDTDTASLEPGTYWHVLKRTDSGFETVLSYGTVALRKAR